MGRIYKVRWKDKAASKPLKLSSYTSLQLIELFKQPNGYYRDLAQRLLVERDDTAAIKNLISIAYDRSNSFTALSSLWTLDAMKITNPGFLRSIATAHSNNFTMYQSCLQQLAENPDKKDAFENLLSLRKKGNRMADICFAANLSRFYNDFPPEVESLLFEILNEFKNDPLVTDVIMSNLENNERSFLKKITATDSYADTIILKALSAAIKRSEQPKEDIAIAHLNKSEKERYFSGKSVFLSYCSTCHGKEGEGMTNIAPPLALSELINKEAETTIKILLDGLTGPVTINGTSYTFNNSMPGLRNNIETNNGDMAAVLTYVRNAFGNKASAITVEQVGKTRASTENRKTPYTISELK
jgi:mono/diheme cytochrome c family protein